MLESLGGFDTALGRVGNRNLQGEETELSARLREAYGEGVMYDPDATVGHKVYPYRTKPKWLVNRAFWQGYSKRILALVTPGASGGEQAFLRDLLLRRVPGRVRRLLVNPSRAALIQLCMVFVLTSAVGVGYLYGILTARQSNVD